MSSTAEPDVSSLHPLLFEAVGRARGLLDEFSQTHSLYLLDVAETLVRLGLAVNSLDRYTRDSSTEPAGR